LWNVAQLQTITVSAQAPAKPESAEPQITQPPDSYKAACLACHDDHMMKQQHLTRAQWDRELGKMTGWGAEIKPQDRDAILSYLSAQFKCRSGGHASRSLCRPRPPARPLL
jgi:hypothetical protein